MTVDERLDRLTGIVEAPAASAANRKGRVEELIQSSEIPERDGASIVREGST